MLKTYLFPILAAFFFLSCKEKIVKPKLVVPEIVAATIMGSWQLSDVTDKGSPAFENEDQQSKDMRYREVIEKGAMLSFFPDGSFTELKGTGFYRSGTWEYINRRRAVKLRDSISTRTVFIRQEVFNRVQVLDLLYLPEKKRESYIRYGDSITNFQNDPFYFSNNDWRVKPGHQETDIELQARLGNYFKHILLILKTAKQRKQQTVSFEFSAGIIKIYNGGIGVEKKLSVPNSWKNAFYNYDDALKAYKMFEAYMLNSHYRGAGTGDWLVDDYKILSEIYEDLLAGKFPAASEK